MKWTTFIIKKQSIMIDLKHDTSFDDEFSRIEEIKYYPYVGKKYGSKSRRVLVFGHNVPVSEKEFFEKKEKAENKMRFATAMPEYLRKTNEKWTQAIRHFLTGASGVEKRWKKLDVKSDKKLETLTLLAQEISFVNFINPLVISDKQTNIKIKEEDIIKSKKINAEIINILKPTHIIIWGKNVKNYIKKTKGFKLQKPEDNPKNIPSRRGFSEYVLINEKAGTKISMLRVFHPGNPGGYKPYYKSTHEIIGDFLNR